MQMTWTFRSYYKKLYLGPLPHLLLCLEQILIDLNAQKRLVIKRLRMVEHQEIDRMMEKEDYLRQVIKAVHNHQKDLLPMSELHEAQDTNKLKQIVVQLDQLMRNTPSVDVMRFREDMALAYKAIVVQPKPKEKEVKSDLVVEDDLYV